MEQRQFRPNRKTSRTNGFFICNQAVEAETVPTKSHFWRFSRNFFSVLGTKVKISVYILLETTQIFRLFCCFLILDGIGPASGWVFLRDIPTKLGKMWFSRNRGCFHRVFSMKQRQSNVYELTQQTLPNEVRLAVHPDGSSKALCSSVVSKRTHAVWRRTKQASLAFDELWYQEARPVNRSSCVCGVSSINFARHESI